MNIERNIYLQKLIDRQQNGLIKIITGVRRCGKSYLLFEIFYNYLLSQKIKKKNIIRVVLDDDESTSLRNPIKLSEYIKSKINEKENFYVFIDEIQLCKNIPNPDLKGEYIGFYDVLNGLLKRKNLDIYITGSNSKMLSTDVLTEFRGRGDEVRIYPLSFREFYSAKGGYKEEALHEYMLYGGLPLILSRNSKESKTTYLRNLFAETYIKDIIERNRLEKENLLSDLINLLCSSIGSLTNTHKLTNTINTIKHRNKENDIINDITLNAYIKHLLNAYLFNEAKRYDIRGKKYLETQSKFYCIDTGLRNIRLNMRQNEETHIMENIIYNNLLQRNYLVDVGVIEAYKKNESNKTQRITKEIDFVINNGDNQCYIQSAFDLKTANKQESELMPFSIINNSFKKIIVTRNELTPWFDEKGIYHIGLVDFLLSDSIL